MKVNFYLASIIILCFSCNVANEKGDVRSFVSDLNMELSGATNFDHLEYFTENGWNSFSRNFRNESEYIDFKKFFTGLEISKVSNWGEKEYQVIFKRNSTTSGSVSIIVKRELDSFKITEFRPSR